VFVTVEFTETGTIEGAISDGELDSALLELDFSTACEDTVGAKFILYLD